MYALTIASVGSGNAQDLTLRLTDALHTGKLILRTKHHPIESYLKDEQLEYESLDGLYDTTEDFDEFNRKAAQRVWKACEESPVCYVVSDAAFDTTVDAIQKTLPANQKMFQIAGVSHMSRCLALIGKVSEGLQVFSAEDFLKARYAPQQALLLMEVHSAVCAGECKLKLMSMLSEESTVILVTGNGKTGDLTACEIPLYELDRQSDYNHLTAVYVSESGYLQRKRYDSEDLRQIIHKLRSPDGCPWDRAQTHESLLTNLLEESWEYIQAVKDGDTDHMYDELGDVLLQVYLHAEIARQHGTFDLDDVTTAVSDKMLVRHEHIFGNKTAGTADEVLTNWEALKREQRGIQTTAQAMRDVSTGLSTLLRASKIQHKAQKVGFDFESAEQALSKVYEEADEVLENLKNEKDPAEELGDLLFATVNVCRLSKKDADLVLQQATEKFLNRFEKMENYILEAGKSIKDLTLREMDVYWDMVKCCK